MKILPLNINTGNKTEHRFCNKTTFRGKNEGIKKFLKGTYDCLDMGMRHAVNAGIVTSSCARKGVMRTHDEMISELEEYVSKNNTMNGFMHKHVHDKIEKLGDNLPDII